MLLTRKTALPLVLAAAVFPDDATSIVRFPIASLGPGTPPD